MKILVTGSRKWTDGALIRFALGQFEGKHTLIHGGAKGADTMAGWVAKQMGWDVEVYPADWAKCGRSAGPIRNNQMLDLEPDIVLAFHEDLENSKGTGHCVKEARKRGYDVKIYSGGHSSVG